MQNFLRFPASGLSGVGVRPGPINRYYIVEEVASTVCMLLTTPLNFNLPISVEAQFPQAD